MTRVDLSNSIAADMDKVLNSEESKQMFSSSSVLEKLAFTRVADEGKLTSEIEEELLTKTAASKCECTDKHGHEKHCDCPKDCSCHKTEKSSAQIVNSLLKVSEELEGAGFEKLAALSIVLAERLVAEAKEKSKSKSSKKDEKASKSKSDKASKKKMTMKERMEKMRKMQKGKKNKGKSSKKSSLQVQFDKRAQQAPAMQPKPQDFSPISAPKREAEVIMGALPPRAKGTRVEVQLDTIKVHPPEMVPTVTQIVQRLQEGNSLPANKRYRVVSA